MLETKTNINLQRFILLADDDIDDQELLIEAILDINSKIHVHTITNGNKTIDFLNQLPDTNLPGLIVLDYNLPEINGSGILDAISKSKRYRAVTKVVWSTSNSPVYKKECLDRGAQAYLVKPSDMAGIQKMAMMLVNLFESKE